MIRRMRTGRIGLLRLEPDVLQRLYSLGGGTAMVLCTWASYLGGRAMIYQGNGYCIVCSRTKPDRLCYFHISFYQNQHPYRGGSLCH